MWRENRTYIHSYIRVPVSTHIDIHFLMSLAVVRHHFHKVGFNLRTWAGLPAWPGALGACRSGWSPSPWLPGPSGPHFRVAPRHVPVTGWEAAWPSLGLGLPTPKQERNLPESLREKQPQDLLVSVNSGTREERVVAAFYREGQRRLGKVLLLGPQHGPSVQAAYGHCLGMGSLRGRGRGRK